MIEKTIEKTTVTQITVWEAFDGTTFEDEEECKKFEESATATLMAKLMECVIVKEPVSEMLECGSDENDYRTIVPTTQEHIDTMNRIYHLYSGKCKLTENLFNKEDIGMPIILGYRIYNNTYDWVWFYNLRKEIEFITDDKYRLRLKDSL